MPIIAGLFRRQARTLEEKRRSDSRYRTVVDQADDGIFLVDAATGRLTEANSSLRRRLGYSADEIVGLKVEDILVETPVIDTLKIDRSFINHVDENQADQAIVSATLAMAKSLGLRVVAEGVETAAQLEVLNRHGCEVAQGFFFSRPLLAEQCRTLLEELATRPSFTETLRMRLKRGLPSVVAPIRASA